MKTKEEFIRAYIDYVETHPLETLANDIDKKAAIKFCVVRTKKLPPFISFSSVEQNKVVTVELIEEQKEELDINHIKLLCSLWNASVIKLRETIK